MSEPPIVLHVFETWSPITSGYVIRSRRVVEHQRDLGIARPHVLVTSRQHALAGHADPTPWGEPVIVAEPSKREVLVRRLRPYDLDAGHLARAVRDEARRVKARIVHSHFSSGIGRGALRGARMAGLPFVSEIRFDLAGAMVSASGNPVIARAEPILRRRFEGHHRHAEAIVAASHALGRLATSMAGNVPVFVAPNGADGIERADEVRAKGKVLRQQLGIDDAVVIGTATNMLAYEGLDRLAPMVADMPDLALLFVGEGAALAALKEQTSRLGVRAVFTGRVPAESVPAHIAALDVFAIPRPPSTVTAFASPLKLAEAMAIGSAVVATDQGDIAHMLRDDHGHVVAPDDDAAFAAALRDLIASPERREVLRERTRARAKAEMTWAETIRAYEGVYAHVLGTTS